MLCCAVHGRGKIVLSSHLQRFFNENLSLLHYFFSWISSTCFAGFWWCCYCRASAFSSLDLHLTCRALLEFARVRHYAEVGKRDEANGNETIQRKQLSNFSLSTPFAICSVFFASHFSFSRDCLTIVTAPRSLSIFYVREDPPQTFRTQQDEGL